MKVSLRAIADETGLSRMAVSLALRGKSGVSEANRKKVLKAAKRLGYEPDPELAKMLSHLRSSKTQARHACLALLTSGPVPRLWEKLVTEKNYVLGVQERALTYGYRVEEFWMNEPGMSLNRLVNIIWSRGIEGVIIAPLLSEIGPGANRRFEFAYDRFSLVEISETVVWPDLDRTLHDQYTSMQRLLEELRALGYRRMGLVLAGALDRRVNGKWTAAYLEDGRRNPESRLKPMIMEKADLSKFKTWCQRERPDVIISVDGFGKSLIEQAGWTIPADIAYATLDLDGIDPERTFFSGIDQNSKHTGAAAVDLLVAAIQRGEKGLPRHPRRLQVEGTWICGASTPLRD